MKTTFKSTKREKTRDFKQPSFFQLKTFFFAFFQLLQKK